MCHPHTVRGSKLYQWRQWAIQMAKANQVEPGEVDWLLQGLTALDSLSLRLGSYRDRTDISLEVSLQQLTAKWQQRLDNRVPVQYLAGETPWRHFSLKVTPDVLIPRPETELIINIAEGLAADSSSTAHQSAGNWADIGTGSGAIALGLARCFPTATIHAVDISSRALEIARYNAQKNKLAHHIIFHQGSWLAPLATLRGQLFGIVSNPPYIPSQTVLSLQPEVTQHEPHLALDGGPDGLDCIRTLIADSSAYLQSGGIWLTELMDGQADTVAHLLEQQACYTHITIHPDLAGENRFVSARKAL